MLKGFGKKKDDKGFNDFQILIAQMRSKLKSTKQRYDLAWNALARAIESGKKPDIRAKALNEYKLSQQVQYLQTACDLAHEIYQNYQDLWAEHPSKEIQDKYVELCTYREAVNVPQLAEFWMKHPLAGDDEAKPILEFDDSNIASYLREFANTHKVNSTGMDNLEILYPEEDIISQIPVGAAVVYPDSV